MNLANSFNKEHNHLGKRKASIRKTREDNKEQVKLFGMELSEELDLDGEKDIFSILPKDLDDNFVAELNFSNFDDVIASNNELKNSESLNVRKTILQLISQWGKSFTISFKVTQCVGDYHSFYNLRIIEIIGNRIQSKEQNNLEIKLERLFLNIDNSPRSRRRLFIKTEITPVNLHQVENSNIDEVSESNEIVDFAFTKINELNLQKLPIKTKSRIEENNDSESHNEVGIMKQAKIGSFQEQIDKITRHPSPQQKMEISRIHNLEYEMQKSLSILDDIDHISRSKNRRSTRIHRDFTPNISEQDSILMIYIAFMFLERIKKLILEYISYPRYDKSFILELLEKVEMRVPNKYMRSLKKTAEDNMDGISSSMSKIYQGTSSENMVEVGFNPRKNRLDTGTFYSLSEIHDKGDFGNELKSSLYITPPIANKYIYTFMITIILTTIMYISYWSFMVWVYSTIIQGFKESHITSDIIEGMALIRGEILDIDLISRGFYQGVSSKQNKNLISSTYDNLKTQSDLLDKKISVLLTNGSHSTNQIWNRTIILYQNETETKANFTTRGYSSLWMMLGYVQDLLKSKHLSNRGFIQLVSDRFSLIYDRFFEFGDSSYINLSPNNIHFSQLRFLVIYIYLGSLVVFFILAIFRLKYHIDIYKYKSYIYECIAKLTLEDIDEVFNYSIKRALFALKKHISIHKVEYEKLTSKIIKRNILKSNLEKKSMHSNQRKAKLLIRLPKPVLSICSYHLLILFVFAIFNLLFLFQLRVFGDYFNSLTEVHTYFFKKSRIYIDLNTYTKLIASHLLNDTSRPQTPTLENLRMMVDTLSNFENEVAGQAMMFGDPFVKSVFNSLSNTDICDMDLRTEIFPFNFDSECPKLLNGRLKAGLYPTEIYLLNQFRRNIDSLSVEGLSHNVLRDSAFDNKKGTIIMNLVLLHYRTLLTDTLNKHYLNYKINNFLIILLYISMIICLVYLDSKCVYSKEKESLARTRMILLFIPPRVVQSNTSTANLMGRIKKREF